MPHGSPATAYAKRRVNDTDVKESVLRPHTVGADTAESCLLLPGPAFRSLAANELPELLCPRHTAQARHVWMPSRFLLQKQRFRFAIRKFFNGPWPSALEV